MVLPVLVFLVIGVIEIGRYMYFGIEIAHAAEAGAQYGAVSMANSESQSGITAAANADAPEQRGHRLDGDADTGLHLFRHADALSVGHRSAGLHLLRNVKITGNMNSLLNYPGIPSNIPVSASTTMRVLSQ